MLPVPMAFPGPVGYATKTMSVPGHEHIEKDGFRLRGLEMSRVDGFSDVVFGFALTLLVLSLEVPKTFAELHESMRGIFAFAISFLFLMMVWWAHFKFFRRFGLHDFHTIVLNSSLLFYVYPLKFLASFLFVGLFTSDSHYFDSQGELRQLMILYGVGFTAVYSLIGALYWNAWTQRDHLELNLLERTLARTYIFETLGPAFVGVLACLFALLLPEHWAGMTGWTYTLIGVYGAIYGPIARRQANAARIEMERRVSPSESLEST